MDVPAPGLDVGLQIGDAIDDGHEESRFGVEEVQLCVYHAVAIRPTSSWPLYSEPAATAMGFELGQDGRW